MPKILSEEDLINELIQLLFYEQSHLAVYDSFAKRVKDTRIAAFFERFKHLEEEHVSKVRTLIEKLGGKSKLRNTITPMAGYVATALTFTDIVKILRFNLSLENRATHGYIEPLKKVSDFDSIFENYLRENQLEAEMMGTWIKEELLRFGIESEVEKAQFYNPFKKNY